MSETAVSSATQRKEAAGALAEQYESLTDSEVIETVLALHKPSANPLVRTVWVVIGSIFVVFLSLIHI